MVNATNAMGLIQILIMNRFPKTRRGSKIKLQKYVFSAALSLNVFVLDVMPRISENCRFLLVWHLL